MTDDSVNTDGTAASMKATKRVSYDSINVPNNDRAAKFAQSRRRSSLQVYKTFLHDFHDSTVGGWLIIFLGFLTAVGVGCLVGVVPQVATQRYAERIFAQDSSNGPAPVCNTLEPHVVACIQGAELAQAAASYSVFARNLVALLTNSIAGRYSDTHGRRGLQIFSLFIGALPPFALLMVQLFNTINPAWFFATESMSGIINWFSIAFTQLSDSTPPRHRAAAYGLYMGAFMGGIAISPFVATLMSHIQIAIFSCIVRTSALLVAILFLPETLQVGLGYADDDDDVDPGDSKMVGHDNVGVTSPEGTKEGRCDSGGRDQHRYCNILLLAVRPFREMSILRRNRTVVLVAIGAFMSKVVYSGDVTLFFYYVENILGATVSDVAGMMFVTGILGVLVQACMLKYLISMVGERRLLVSSFVIGAIHNAIYGLAPNKWVIYAGLCLSQLSHTSGPLLSALASRNVADTEQGRVQGALFGLTSLAEAIGPLCYNKVFRTMHDTAVPGSMFLFGAVLYLMGFLAVSMIPPKAAVTMISSAAISGVVSPGDEINVDAEKADNEEHQEVSRLLQ